MRKVFSLLVAMVLTVICSTPGVCFSVSLIPDFQTVGVDEMAMFDLNISGLGDYESPSLGAFDVDIIYDQSVLDFKLQSVVFSDFLGPSNQFVSLFPGRVWLGEVSLISATQLNDLQPAAFTIVSFSFLGLNADNTSILFSPVTMSDENGYLLVELNLSKSVTVVPLPGSIILLASGVGALAVVRKKLLMHQQNDKKEVL